MHFSVTHVFRGITLEEYEQLYFDEAFNEALCSTVKLSRQVIKIDRTDTGIHREVKVGPDREIPKPVAKVLKADRIEYTEHLDYKWGAFKGTWETIPTIMPTKVSTSGTFRFEASGDGVRRVVDGDISVKILGVGGVVEKFIVADIERSYDDAARFTQRWIDQGKHKAN